MKLIKLLIADLQFKGDGAYAPITSVRKIGQNLYFGSIEYPAIGHLPIPSALLLSPDQGRPAP